MGNDGNGLVEALLGLPGFRVLAVAEGRSELVVTVETVIDRVGCASCGVRAEAQDRMAVAVRDLACFGRPVCLVWVSWPGGGDRGGRAGRVLVDGDERRGGTRHAAGGRS